MLNEDQKEDLKKKTGAYLLCYYTPEERRQGLSLKKILLHVALAGSPSPITFVPLREIAFELLGNLEKEGFSYHKGLYFERGSVHPALDLSIYDDLDCLIVQSR